MEKEKSSPIKTLKDREEKDTTMPEYIYAYDPIIKKRVVHVVVDGYAISMVTGNRFRYHKTKGR